MTNYRRSADAIHDRIVARLKAQPSKPQQFRRICCFCQRVLGPAIGNYTNDTHGVCEPLCPEAKALGWQDATDGL